MVTRIEKLDRGKKMVDTAPTYRMNHSTMGTILKDKIMVHVKSATPMKSTRMPKKCGKVIKEMKKLLSLRM